MDEIEKAIARELRKVLDRDPLFAPAAEVSFKLERKLGEGGMGVVHLVTDRRLGRRAALKMIKARSGEDTAVARFLREARITARLDHPGIPPVYEAGRTVGGEHFLLMRFVDGRSLETILSSKDRPGEGELLGILIKVAEAVAYANDRHVVHRDLKPANIMVGAFGEVLVMDWGLARDLDEAKDTTARGANDESAPVGLTQVGTVLGTLGYMPPEQANGEDVDGRADVFALGAILVEILTGEPPIKGNSFANRLMATIQGTIELPRTRRPAVPIELHAIAAHALALSPDDRYQDAALFASDLRAHLEGRAVSVHRYRRAELASRLLKRHPGVFLSLALVVVVSVSAAVVLWRKSIESDRKSVEILGKNAQLEQAQHEREILDRSQKLLSEARRLLKVKRGEELETSVERALAMSPSERNLLEAAEILIKASRFEKAVAALRRCADTFPPGYEALWRLAELETDFQRRPVALVAEILARAHARRDENVIVDWASATDAAERGDIAAAIHFADSAIARAPERGSSYLLRANMYMVSANEEAVHDNINEALNRDPLSSPAWGLQGLVYLRANRFEEAFNALTRAIECDPDNYFNWLRRASARRVAGQNPRQVLDDVKRALELRPGDPDALRLRGTARAQLGETAGAIEDLEAYLRSDPQGPIVARARDLLEQLKARR